MAATPVNAFDGVTSINWGFTAADVWTNSMFIVSSLTVFVLLGIAVMFAPRIIALIKGAIGGGGGGRGKKA